ncbi:MAG: c-type cytochrome [Betaproteobacteria bacterium]|nr:MAG: c-type cytochrome [Betaproteobacteria bacterium]
MPKHISRILAILAAGLAIALVAKWYFTTGSFYEFGHYRGDSVAEIAAKQPVLQTSGYCKSCHSERHLQWSAANHKSVQCEVCHGAGEGHPQKGKLPIPSDTRKLCSLCHERMPGRPAAQPQIVLAEHGAEQQCIVCHNPHAPKITGVVAKVSGDAAAGAKKHAAACAACHGANAISANDAWPNLAGQHAAYLVRILGAFKSGAQTDVMMSSVAKDLSDPEIQNLAAYYAGLTCNAAAAEKAAGDAAAGKLLAKNCAACHGEAGAAPNPAWPNLAGQKGVYLANALKAFRAGLRKDPMMAGVARGLSDADIVNLAAYYAAQSCGKKP